MDVAPSEFPSSNSDNKISFDHARTVSTLNQHSDAEVSNRSYLSYLMKITGLAMIGITLKRVVGALSHQTQDKLSILCSLLADAPMSFCTSLRTYNPDDNYPQLSSKNIASVYSHVDEVYISCNSSPPLEQGEDDERSIQSLEVIIDKYCKHHCVRNNEHKSTNKINENPNTENSDNPAKLEGKKWGVNGNNMTHSCALENLSHDSNFGRNAFLDFIRSWRVPHGFHQDILYTL
jgi:hypothetical protein